MSSVIDNIERAQLRRVPSFEAGDRVRVHFQVVEGNRRRTQVFEGIVIKRQGTGLRETFTVRKQSFGVGVERTFPVHSPKIEQIEVAARGDVRRAKLYYLRDRVGRGARVRERRFAPGDNPNEVIVPETAARRRRGRHAPARDRRRRAAGDEPLPPPRPRIRATRASPRSSRPTRPPPPRPLRPRRRPAGRRRSRRGGRRAAGAGRRSRLGRRTRVRSRPRRLAGPAPSHGPDGEPRQEG